jgi:hypothetical protein
MSRRHSPLPARPLAFGLAVVFSLGLSGCDPAEVGARPHAGSAATAGGGHEAHAEAAQRPMGIPPGGTADVARMRAATSVYHDFSRAEEDGFVDASGVMECAEHPELGAMGIHFLRRDHFEDLAVDPARPEILLYLPQPDGRMELVGVEFAVNAEAWHAAHGPDRIPSLAGVDYDPPNPEAHNPLPRTAYTLHVWVWKENPAGMFAPFNPNLRCDG